MDYDLEAAAEYHPLPAKAAGVSSKPGEFTIMDVVFSILFTAAILAIGRAFLIPVPVPVHNDPEPRLFIRLVEAEGLDPCVREVSSPVFDLAVEVDQVSESTRGPCAGGGDDDAMLRVSYRGVILAWGKVPRFCIDGRSSQGPGASVATTLLATAKGSVLREEMRNLIRAEICALGRAEFDVEGSLPGLGHLRCKTYLFHGDDPMDEPLPPCHL
ncbi:unnamed protein product [Urochloa decumbens]|uniref:Uncharacterized protein n=1 Tax=Urochloa decumbens TaxID=240449 RepID=A0ABC8Z5W5_9POAL